jgi:hypothetical protein
MPASSAVAGEDLDEVLTGIGIRLYLAMETADRQRPGWHREAPALTDHLVRFLEEVLPSEVSDAG